MEKIKWSLLGMNFFKLNIFQSQRRKHVVLADGGQRYEVCKLLADHQVPNMIWLEDLLALHGSDTQVWDLHLLVEDPTTAVKTILDKGYQITTPETKFENDPEFSKRATRLVHNCPVDNFLPSLPKFLDSLIEFWLNISSRDYVDRLVFALYIGCLINYCYTIQSVEGESVKTPNYAEKLKPEHREVHYNITSPDPKEESFTTTSRHAYHVRRSKEIKEGLFTPRPYEKSVFKPPLTTVAE